MAPSAPKFKSSLIAQSVYQDELRIFSFPSIEDSTGTTVIISAKSLITSSMPEFFSLNDTDRTYTINGAAASTIGAFTFQIKLTNGVGVSTNYELEINIKQAKNRTNSGSGNVEHNKPTIQPTSTPSSTARPTIPAVSKAARIIFWPPVQIDKIETSGRMLISP